MEKITDQLKTGRQIQAEQTRHTILETAKRLIGEKGFDGVTITQIAREAGVSKGLFYHYFRSKDDIIIEGYSECDEYFEREIRDRLQGETAWERILEFLDHQMAYAESVGIDLITQTYKSQIQYGTDFFTSRERSLPKILRSVVGRGQASGDLTAEPDADYITGYLLRFSRGLIYDWCLHRGEFNLRSTAAEALSRLEPLFNRHSRTAGN